MDSEKVQAPKARKDKKKNTETGLLMGQNTNIFSQLSATYLQSKQSATQQQANFVNSTQIIEYHDPNINRLIALLRKKADVTKAKAAVQLRQEIGKMSQDNIQQFIQTFSHLFMEIVINEQSKQVIDEFVSMVNFVFTNFKKIAIKEVATIFGPLLVIYKSNNISQSKSYSLLFTGTQEQMQQKAITLLLNKNVMKKFLIFCRVIIQCEEVHKIGQQNFQRNCSSLLKVLKQFIKNYQNMTDKKQEIINSFGRFVLEISDIVSGKFAQQYFKVGGKAKGSFLEFYQVLVSEVSKHPQWKIDWENYAKIICQNYLDKDNLVQQTLWKYCNRQFIKSSLEIQQFIQKEQGKEKEKYWILQKYLPKPDQKLLSVLKIGGQALYKQLPSYCTVFPFTSFEAVESHKSLINKISFVRKLMQHILQQQDENEARIQCYYQIALYIIPLLRNCTEFGKQLDQKKKQQVKTLSLKTQKQIVNSIQDRYYKNPPTSRNSFTYNVPTYFCKLISEVEPQYDFVFDAKETFPLYCLLKNQNHSEFVKSVFEKIYQNCKNDLNLTVQYLENFPSKSINIDLSENNPKIEESAKIFLLSTEAKDHEKWFNENWDIRKSAVIFDPRISPADLKAFEQSHSYIFKPSNRSQGLESTYISQEHDDNRFDYFIRCLEDEEKITIIQLMVPLIKDILLQRNTENKIKYINQILSLHSKSVDLLVKKHWVVSETSILRLRATCDIIIEGLKAVNIESQSFDSLNKQLLEKFLVNYCLFVQNTFNYKLEQQSEELLKQIPKVLSCEFNSKYIFQSVRKTIKNVFQSLSKVTQKEITEGEDKQRKNRLLRALGFVRKLLWYCLNKKKQQYYVCLVEDALQNSEWKNAEFRPDLWMLLEAIIEVADASIKRKVAVKIVQQYQKYTYFMTILMCCQLVLPLQRHPSTKKAIVDLQNEILKVVIKQINNSELNIQILMALINDVLSSQSLFLIDGVKNLLKSLMKNYQNISAEHLKLYQTQLLEKQILSLKSDQQNFNKKCLLAINLCAQMPLLDFEGIQKIYENLTNTIQKEQTSMKVLGYLAILGTIWDSSVGIDKITNQFSACVILKFSKSLKDTIGQKLDENSNFARFFALTFLNSFLQVKSKESLNQDWQFIISNLVLAPVKQGSLLHGSVQSCRYKAISKIFSFCPEKTKNQIVLGLPEQILRQVRFYKQVLDEIEDEDTKMEGAQKNHHENITNMFIEFAQVLVRITSCLNKQTKPEQRLILELLQCPFPGIKKTSFILLKQMYELNFVSKNPPVEFISYLKLNPEILKSPLEPATANIISGYLYSWQALINRRGAIQKSSEDEGGLTLEDYLQSEQLHESFLKNIFDILETHLEYSKNQQQYEIAPEQLVQMDSVVSIQDDLNLQVKVFRLVIRTLFMFVENFPLFIRDFVDKNKKFKSVCEKLLRNVISDAIFKEQITKIEMREQQWKAAGNFQIYVIPKNKEIYAEYTHDVIRIGLRLFMKSNYPLTPIVIEFGQGLKIQDGSRWALMLQTQLHSRNNTIINGILLWKDNIDKKLAGVEQCSICFDIVNGNGQLPKKGCKTCKKKFHSVCIMKWFSKSNKSQCPLCKSQFL